MNMDEAAHQSARLTARPFLSPGGEARSLKLKPDLENVCMPQRISVLLLTRCKLPIAHSSIGPARRAFSNNQEAPWGLTKRESDDICSTNRYARGDKFFQQRLFLLPCCHQSMSVLRKGSYCLCWTVLCAFLQPQQVDCQSSTLNPSGSSNSYLNSISSAPVRTSML